MTNEKCQMTNDEVRTPSTDTCITNKEHASTDTFHEHESNEYESKCEAPRPQGGASRK